MTFRQALITGATSGIGEELAHLLARKKIPLILIGRNEKKLKALKKELGVTILAADLGKKPDRKKIVRLIHKMHPDLVVNCAGIRFWGEATKIPVKDHLTTIETNISALVELSIETAKTLMRRREKGVILNVSSLSGEMPTPKLTTYAASKAFVISFSRAMDLELEPYGIRVLVSRPGLVNTPMIQIKTGKHARGMVMSPQVCAKQLWKQILKRKRTDIPDWRYLPLYWLSKVVPDRLNHAIQKKLFKPKKT